MDWPNVVETIRIHRPAVRVKWSGDDDVPQWNPWIIISTDGYIETGSTGPVSFRDVEWLETAWAG